ncbi:uncharacterized protein CXQ87_002879 [Candidozyma duobushaemuli]|uniref:Uncharacterized protein n=2 Tax=Candidozyma TaxID=3303203 RepID=A0ABX8I3K6_9ASCO|nr:uncharacterized protein CXQ87_002879 [[Candida] duobushaemulonis]PVH14732.1 hypothetical protein CXQ87_002879 [[Candida] duobushaemulonis]QWU87130.1 hypothetical protein CA3LBN_001395 [[Candida] haemuloni]
MLFLPIFALLGTPVLGEDARTYEYSDDRLFTVVFSGSNVEDLATTTTTIAKDSSTRVRTFLTYTGEGARPTGEASLNDTDESDPESDAEDLYSSDDDGIFIDMHEDDEAGSASSEASSGASASDSGASASPSGSGTSASGSGSETSGASGSETSGASGSETSGASGSETSGSGVTVSSFETSGNNGAALSNGLGALFAAVALALL